MIAVVLFAAAGILWGAGLVVLTGWLGRRESRRRVWANAAVFGTVLLAGILTGAGLIGQLLYSAALAELPESFTLLVRGPLGDAEALPFITLNPLVEWLFVPSALLLCWRHPRRRRLLLAALVAWFVHRVWTYLYFVPLIDEWGDGPVGEPLTADQLDQARLWVGLTWLRSLLDLATMVLVLLAAFVPMGGSRKPATPQPVPA